MIFTVFVLISTIKYCEAFIIETLTITSIYTMLYCSIKLDYDSKKEDIITIEKDDNIYNQIDIYRGQFEVGYTSYIKNANGKWYLFNDRAVNEVKQESVVSPKAYVLFYRKKDMV